MQSAGGDLIDRTTYETADDVLNGPEAVEAMTTWQQWIESGYVDIEAVDDLPFQQKEIPIQWVGHWLYTPNKAALGDDLVVLPLPDFGEGAVSPSGSWNWGISQTAEEPDAVWAWLEFLLSDETVVEWSGELGNPPATKSAITELPVFQPEGDMGIFSTTWRRLPSRGLRRPPTPPSRWRSSRPSRTSRRGPTSSPSSTRPSRPSTRTSRPTSSTRPSRSPGWRLRPIGATPCSLCPSAGGAVGAPAYRR